MIETFTLDFTFVRSGFCRLQKNVDVSFNRKSTTVTGFFLLLISFSLPALFMPFLPALFMPFFDPLVVNRAAIIQAKIQETSAREEGEVSKLDPNTRRRVCNDRVHPISSLFFLFLNGYYKHDACLIIIKDPGIKVEDLWKSVFVSTCVIGLTMLSDYRKLFQVVPDDVKHMWNEWAPRGLIVISLVSQITLTLLGNERKYNPRTRIRMPLFAYLLALAAASSALGEDNELSLRHFVEIVFQFPVALYIFLLSWPGCSDLPKLSVLVYLAGFIKCFGRIKALRLAKTENLRDSMLGPPDAGPNYPKFLEDFLLKKSQGFDVNVEEVAELSHTVNIHLYPEEVITMLRSDWTDHWFIRKNLTRYCHDQLLEVEYLEVLPSKLKGDRCNSALFDGCRLALTLKKMGKERMRKVMSQVWIENLSLRCYSLQGISPPAATSERWSISAHVWLLKHI
nr:hypothetical protein CTI12_AA610890 [Tanacetum cinerariifolium]